MNPAAALDKLGDALLARMRDLACVDLAALLAGAEQGDDAEATSRQLLIAFSEDVADALAEARDACIALDRVRPPTTRPIDADPLALAEQPADARRGQTDEDIARLTQTLQDRAHRRRRAAAIEAAAAPLLAKLHEADRRQV